MLCYRNGLTNIGIPKTAPLSYLGFDAEPRSLRQAIRSMYAPTADQWSQVSDIFHDDSWVDEVQGVRWDGPHWIFSANAKQAKPGNEDKAIHVFKAGDTLADGNWVSRIKHNDVSHPFAGTHGSDDHGGQLTFFEGRVYVAHFWAGGQTTNANVIVFKDINGVLEYWIEFKQPTSATNHRTERAEFQTINTWYGKFYTCFGGGDIYEFFIHEREGPQAGKWTQRAITLKQPVKFVRGACFSPNGHLYISTNAKLAGDPTYQTIWYYAALNGHRFGVIPVLLRRQRTTNRAKTLSVRSWRESALPA